MWYRIFCRAPEEVKAEVVLEHLHERRLPALGHFKGDDLGWTSGEIHLGPGSPVLLARFLTGEDDLRHDLNTWAAELETLDYSPQHAPLMERVIQTQQLLTLRKPIDHADEVSLDRLCEELCRFFCSQSDGVYQADGVGWVNAEGELLVREY